MGLLSSLGKTITPRELASFLRVSYQTVIANYQCLGGQRIGKRIIFFENKVIHALEKRPEMDCPSQTRGAEDTEGFCDQAGSLGVGSKPKKTPGGRMASKHGIFPWENKR